MSSNGASCSLEVKALTLRRGGECIVEAFDWLHEPGRVAWITGPNGVGKSTLMRVLAGIVPPDVGTVRHLVDGVPVPAAMVAGYYSPSMGLPVEARADGFVKLAQRLVPANRLLAPERPLGAKRCGSLSTGEEKRLLLAPLLARQRPFLFLDEPYEHLSRDARITLTHELVRVAAAAVVVVATNQPIPAEASGPVLTLSVLEAPHVA